MNNQQIFDIFNSSVFDASVIEIEDEEDRYEIRLYNGSFLSTIGISTDVSDAADERLIDELNRDQAPFRYSMKDGKLQCTAFIWIDHRPSRKALSEMIAIMTCNLKNVRQILKTAKEEKL